MVKNQTGGNRAKSFARKNETSHREHQRIRLSECDEEVYACVNKLYGNTCSITTIDGISLIGHIRKKFSGRGKRMSIISDRSVVLVGMRHWENPAKHCDILEVYSPHEVEQLKNIPNIRFERLSYLITPPVSIGSVKSGDEAFDFGISVSESKTTMEDELSGTKTEKFELKEEDEIDIDDI